MLSLLLIFAFTLILYRKWIRQLWQTEPPEVQYPATILEQELGSLKAPPAPTPQNSSMISAFKPGIPNPPGYNYTKTIVVPKLKITDTSWLDEELPDVPKAIYVVDDEHAPLHPPKNKGREAMVYLSYIVDFYDSLPDISIFIHAHRWAWHNNDLLDKDTAMVIRYLNPERVIREGYMNLRCHWYPGCPEWLKTHAMEKDPEKEEEVLVAGAWKELFPTEPMPDVLAQPCCSQFALSRERIRALPRDEYERLRLWLLSTELENSMSGRIFEYVWQWIWAGQSVICPSMHECYCDGFAACFDSDDEFKRWLEMRYYLREDDSNLIKWQIRSDAYAFYTARGDMDEANRVERLGEEQMRDFRLGMDERWFELAEKREAAFANGRDGQKRAQIMENIRNGNHGDASVNMDGTIWSSRPLRP